MKVATGITVLVLAMALVVGCGGDQADDADAIEPDVAGDLVADESIVEEVADEIVLSDTLPAAVVFLTGTVTIGDDDIWLEADIGMALSANETIVVGPESSCEIQIGRIATVRIDENTEVEVRDLYTAGGATQTRLNVATGSVVSRVSRLAGREEFAVESPTTVAGVRGTLFKTTVESDGTTTVAVREGVVDVRPAVPQIDQVDPENEDTRESIAVVRSALDQAATQVQENQQITVAPEASLRAVTAIESEVTPAREAILATRDGRTEEETAELESAARQIEAAARAAASIGAPQMLADELREELDQTRLDPEQVIDPQTDTIRRDLINLTVVSEPAGAAITLNGNARGRNNVSVLLPRGSEVEVTVALAGYVTKSFVITLAESRGRVLTVPLEPVATATLSVTTTPTDADIVIGSEIVGSGSYQAEFELGTELTVGAIHPDYLRADQSVSIDEAREYSVALALEMRPKRSAQGAPPEPETAAVTVSTTPATATIALNGVEVGVGTVQTELEIGSRLQVRADADGYVGQERTLLVGAGENRFVFELEPEIVYAPVELEIQPANARIILDGQRVGTGTYRAEHEVGTRLRFSLEADGYYSGSLTVLVAEGRSAAYRRSLEKEPVLREITIVPTPGNATVRVEGFPASTGASEFALTAGETYQLSLEAERYRRLSQEITITETSPARVALSLEPIPYAKLAITTDPSDASITLDGRRVGNGSYEAEYEVPATVAVRVSASDYEPDERAIELTEAGELELRVELARSTAQLSVRASPASAQILIDGAPAGSGSASRELPIGTRVNVGVTAEGYESQERSLTVGRSGASLDITLEQRVVERTITFVTTPANAELQVDGQFQSTREIDLVEGNAYTVRLSADRYQPVERKIDVRAGSPARYELRLEPQLILWRETASVAPLVRSLEAASDTIVFAASNGAFGAVDVDGRLLWSIATSNNPNDNSRPVVGGRTVYFSGLNEMVAADLRSGAISERRDLPGDTNHIYGQTVTPLSEGYAFPTLSSVVVPDAKRSSEVAIPGGTTMSAATDGDRLFIVNNDGALIVIEIGSAMIEAEIESSAIQPLAHAPAIAGNRVYFVGRRGTLACVDVAAGSEAWSADLGDRAITNPVATSQGVYVFAGGAIHGYAANGSQLFAAIAGASTPPAVQDGILVWGRSDGSVAVASPDDGRVLATAPLPATPVTRPVVRLREIIVGLADGSIVSINRDALGY